MGVAEALGGLGDRAPLHLVDLVVGDERAVGGVRLGLHQPVVHDLVPTLRVAVAGSSRRARRARSVGLSPPRPRAGRSPRHSRRGRPCPSAGSSRRSGAGGRAAPASHRRACTGGRCRRRRGRSAFELTSTAAGTSGVRRARRRATARATRRRRRPRRRRAPRPRTPRRRRRRERGRAATARRRPRPGGRRAPPGRRRRPPRSASLPCRPRARPPRRRSGTRLARIRTACRSSSGGSSARSSTSSRSLRHGLRDQIAELELEVVRPPADGIADARRRQEAFEQLEVPVGAHAGEQLVARGARARRAGRRAADRRATSSMSACSSIWPAKPLEEHVGVAHRAEQAAQPLQLVADRLVPPRVEHLAERAQVGAQPAGGDARLVHVLGVVTEADAGVVREERAVDARDRGAHDLGGRRREVEVTRRRRGRAASSARGPSARTIFERCSGAPAPASSQARSRSTSTSSADAASTNSTSSSRKRARRRGRRRSRRPRRRRARRPGSPSASRSTTRWRDGVESRGELAAARAARARRPGRGRRRADRRPRRRRAARCARARRRRCRAA